MQLSGTASLAAPLYLRDILTVRPDWTVVMHHRGDVRAMGARGERPVLPSVTLDMDGDPDLRRGRWRQAILLFGVSGRKTCFLARLEVCRLLSFVHAERCPPCHSLWLAVLAVLKVPLEAEHLLWCDCANVCA